jgi:hypothetical protein
MIATLRRCLSSRDLMLLGGCSTMIVTAIALRVLESRQARPTGYGRVAPRRPQPETDTLELDRVTIDERALTEQMWGHTKLVMRRCNVTPSDEESSATTVDKLDLDELYPLPSCRFRVLTLHGVHDKLGAFIQKHSVQKLRLMDWGAVSTLVDKHIPENVKIEIWATDGAPNYDDLREVTRSRRVDLHVGNQPHEFKMICANLAFDSKCHLFLRDKAILDVDAVREMIELHHNKFEHLSIPPSEYEWPFLQRSDLGLEWSRH